MKDFLILFKSKLARRTVLYILLFSSLITLFFTSLQLYLNYQKGLERIDGEIEEISSTNLKPLEENLWLLNLRSINLMLEGILQNKDISRLEIVDENGERLTVRGKMPKKNYRSYSIPLSYEDHGKKIPLGQLNITATLENVYQELLDTIVYVLITQTIKTFIVSIFIIFIVWFFIARHLSSIQHYAEKLKLGHPQDDLSLSRRLNHWTRNDELSSLVSAINHMRREVQASYGRVRHLSYHDPLTGLPNRRFLEKMLNQQVLICRQNGHHGALLFLDMDNFKLLNESLGHTTGDLLLIEIARRITSMAKKANGGDGLVARIGGDEFIILSDPLAGSEEQARQSAIELAEHVQKAIARSIVLADKKYRLSASIGITLYGQEACSCETLLKQADNALHESKSMGRNRVSVFHPDMQKRADEQLEMERRLHSAIRNQEIAPYYQPKVDRYGKTRSAEALARWHTRDGGTIPPNQFIPIAENTGLIVELGKQLISSVFAFAYDNLERFERHGLCSIAINVSARQFLDTGFSDFVIDEARRIGIDPGFFILEITEEAVMQDLNHTISALQRLKDQGFHLSIDDFGTGYSSLRYLKDFPLDELKIDKSFVDHVVKNRSDRAIVMSIIDLALNLDLNIVAEGVETREQFDLLCKLDCQFFQGYLFSRPLPQDQFIEQLAKHETA